MELAREDRALHSGGGSESLYAVLVIMPDSRPHDSVREVLLPGQSLKFTRRDLRAMSVRETPILGFLESRRAITDM